MSRESVRTTLPCSELRTRSAIFYDCIFVGTSDPFPFSLSPTGGNPQHRRKTLGQTESPLELCRNMPKNVSTVGTFRPRESSLVSHAGRRRMYIRMYATLAIRSSPRPCLALQLHPPPRTRVGYLEFSSHPRILSSSLAMQQTNPLAFGGHSLPVSPPTTCSQSTIGFLVRRKRLTRSPSTAGQLADTNSS